MCSKCFDKHIKDEAEAAADADADADADSSQTLLTIATPMTQTTVTEPSSPLPPAAPASSPLISADEPTRPPQQIFLSSEMSVIPQSLPPSSTPLMSMSMSPSPSPSPSTIIAAISQPIRYESPPSPVVITDVPTAASPDKKRKNRCQICRVKIGLTFFSCRCDDSAQFCATHRYPHAHSCTFDHKQQKKALIEKANPVVKNDQFEKI
jgi:hypothetical protein